MEDIRTVSQPLLEKSFHDLDRLQNNLEKVKVDLTNIATLPKEAITSNLHISDIVFTITAGVVGGTFSSSKKVSELLDKVHEYSSDKNAFFGKIFHHVGDHIDKPNGVKFLTRNGDNPEVPFHRVLFGHDVFSNASDNPFIVSAKQYGILRGLLQAVRHLIADTFSKQGLPIPGHSYFDFLKESGGTGNYLIEITKRITKDAKLANPDVDTVKYSEAFNHLFTLRAQDIVSQGLTWGLCLGYFKVSGIKDKVRQSQIKILAYFISLFTNFFVGMSKTGGVPYINWATLTILIKEFVNFYRLNWLELKHLEKITANIVKENQEIEALVFSTGTDLISYETGLSYIQEIKKQEKLYEDLINIFEED